MKIKKFIKAIILCMAVVLALRYVATKALFVAIELENAWGVRTAILLGADVNAVRYNSLRARISETNATPLIIACRTENLEIIKILVNAKADINKAEPLVGVTPLVEVLGPPWREKGDRYEIAFYLIENGANIPQKHPHPIDYELMSSVFVSKNASEKEKEDSLSMFRYLLQYQTIENANENGPYTVFISACGYNNMDVVLYMLDNNLAEVNEQSGDGMSGLMRCGVNGHAELCEILLNRGADTSLMDNVGKTAYDYAVEHGHEDVAKILLAAQ